MIPFVAPLAAAMIVAAGPQHARHSHHKHTVHASRSIRQETSLQRRVARMANLALLMRREALLHDFLVAASTETPVFHDDTTFRLAPGIQIDSTRVSSDFIGSPIIRARVTNLSAQRQVVLLEADIASPAGMHGRAAEALTLWPGETRTVELLCPAKIAPASLIWSTTPL